jgi:predicted short-subunit dehydrogenase-like oxidoreductase (DUF2520 family)
VPLERVASTGSDLLLVAVADPALDAVAADLATRPQARVALHTSGSRTAEVLAPLRRAGSAVGSLHPLKAFPRVLFDPEAARGVTFAVDGDAAAQALAGRLATAWNATAAEVPAAQRDLYHFGATLAAGGVVTLLAAAGDLAARLGLPSQVADGYRELARGALAEAGSEPASGITGPVARGDRDTVLRQLAALAETVPELAPLARELALATLRLMPAAGAAGEARRRLAAELQKGVAGDAIKP